MNRPLLSLVLLLACATPGELIRAADSPQTLPVLQQARQVLNLSFRSGTNQFPVKLKGVVTLFDRRGQLFFVQDASAGIYIYAPVYPPGLEEGQLVDIQGVSNQGQFSPIVDQANVTLLGPASMPPPLRIDGSQLQTGGYDCQRVEMEGVVRLQKTALDHIELTLVSDGHRFTVWVFTSTLEAVRSFVDTRVRIVGVAAATYDGVKNPTAFIVFCPREKDVTVVEEAPSSLFDQPLQRLSDLKSYSPKLSTDHRIRVLGTVTMAWPGKFLFLQDENVGIPVQTVDRTAARPGEAMEAVGFPIKNASGLELEDAHLRAVASSNAPVAPVFLAGLRTFPREMLHRLVQVEAELLHRNTSVAGQISYLVRAKDDQYFVARLNYDPAGTFGAPPISGSRIRLTGVLDSDIDQETGEKDLKLWLRSSDDVVVLQRPVSWYTERLLGLLGVLSTLIVAGFVWVGLMKRRVQRETESIRRREKALEARYTELFENAYDIIYTHDMEGRLTSVNKAGEQLIGYSRDQLMGRGLAGLLAESSRGLPRELMEKLAAGQSRTRFEVEIVSQSGQPVFFEVDCRLENQTGQPPGVKGFARDISARKLAEKALLHSEYQLRHSLDERERISRDLHDGIIQSIYAVGLGLEDCRRLIGEAPRDAEHRLSRALDGLNSVIRDVRHFIGGIEAKALKGRELKTALKSLVLTMGENYSNQFLIDVDPVVADGLTSEQTAHLLNIAKEAMSNSTRHAGARTTVVSLKSDGVGLVLEISDDGAGFEPDHPGEKGMGLRNITARAAEMGANLRILSKPGDGTRIILKLPRKP